MSERLSIRTQVRDAFVAALKHIVQSPSARVPGAEVVTNYLTIEEIKKTPTYCVVVTNEDIAISTQTAADAELTVLVVLYVKSDADVRAVLDAAIDDVWDILKVGQSIRSVAPKIRLGSIETDEGTTGVKPFAQAVMRWTAQVRRDVTW